MRLCSIASGSSGNCIYVGSDTTHLLIDDGISCKRTCEGINGLGLKPQELDAIFITHEHSDHIDGLSIMSKRYNIPIYATAGTIEGIKRKGKEIDHNLFYVVKADEKISIKDMIIDPMRISHDANEPVAYRIYNVLVHDDTQLLILTQK